MFDTRSATQAGKLSGVSRRRKTPVAQILEMQAVLLAIVLDEKTTPKDRASCSKSWKELEAQKRIIKGQPNPGSLRPAQHSRTKRNAATPPEEAPDNAIVSTEKESLSSLPSVTAPPGPDGATEGNAIR